MDLLLTALGCLGEPFIKRLAEKICDYAIQQFFLLFGVQHGVGNDFTKLKTSLAKAEDTISRAENMWIKDEASNLKQQLKEFLMQLKDAAYDAEDLLDEIQYEVLKQNMEQRGPFSLPDFLSGLCGRRDDVNRLGEIEVRLDKITDAIEKVCKLLGADDTGKKEMITTVTRNTSSFLVETQVFGREKELNELMGLLLKSADGSGSSSSKNFSVLTIVGLGGVGKTTLAQQAYNSPGVDKYFDLKIWICVSEDFNVERLTKEIIECATRNKCDRTKLDELQEALNNSTASKRLLLVLDDVWKADGHNWRSLCSPLTSVVAGSKILVTTRSRQIADMVRNVNAIHLNGLDGENYWEFFKKCAFGSQNSGDHPQLEAIAKEISGRQKGLPLAARTLGGLLNANLDENYWTTIMGSEIWQLPQDENGVLPVLQLSYQHLPAHLKRCFTFCSMFPKDYPFKEDNLIRIWMAEGFIAAPGGMRMEDLGSNYFHELVSRSFFQKTQGGWSGDLYYVMHDLIHDLAQLISEGETRRLEYGKPRDISSMLRHLSVQVTKDMDPKSLMEFQSFNKLRTLTLTPVNKFQSFNKGWLSARNLIERLKSIRVLILQACGLEELPETIGALTLLRYFDISDNPGIRRLPESICGLDNLQTLILAGCGLQELPETIGDLTLLRYFDISHNRSIRRLPESICGLDNLQTLILRGCDLQELPETIGALKLLRYFDITYNRGIRRLPELIGGLDNLQTLILAGCGLQELPETIGDLTLLRYFDISHNRGIRRLPESIRGLYNLQTLNLAGCDLQELPETIGDLILLRYFDISYNRGIRRLPESLCGLYNLQTLILQGLQLQSLPKGMSKLINLRQLDAPRDLVSQIHEVGKLTSLQKLSLFQVSKEEGHKLAELNGLSQLRGELIITSLENVESIEEARKARLDNKECLDELVLEWASDQGSSDLENNALLVSEEEVLDGLQPHHSLKRLTIRGYSGARPPCWMVAGVLSKLEFLLLENCKRWEDVSCVGQLPHLRVLRVRRMPMVKQISDEICGTTERDWFPRLEQLELEDVTALEELPKVGKLPCLHILCIKGISAVKKIGRGFFGATDQGECFPRLEELVFTDMPAWEEWSWVAELFPCLRMLQISGCPELKRLPPLPISLEQLHLSDVGLTELTELWEGIDGSSSSTTASHSLPKCPNIYSIKIEECEELTWLPMTRFKELTSLEKLRITCCRKLMSMTQDEDIDLLHLPPSIRKLALSGNLGKSLPGCLHNLTSLTKLKIYDCPNLVSLPREALLQLESLESLTISGCGELRSIEGLGVLESLEELEIARCPNLLHIEGGDEQGDEGLSLSQLGIDDTALLKLSPLRKTLPSIEYLYIQSSDQVIMFDGEEQELLRSLTSLYELALFNCENLQSLPTELHALPCLESLRVYGCPQIASLPEKGLPASLTNLEVEDCHPMLTEQVAERERRLPSDV